VRMKFVLISVLLATFPMNVVSQNTVPEQQKFNIVFPYEKECGRQAEESQYYTNRTGRITRVNSERSVTFLQNTENGNPSKKEFVVFLAGVHARDNKSKVRDFLINNVLNQEVEITGNLRRPTDKKFEGLVFLMNEKFPEIDWVGEYLIENGLARYAAPAHSYVSPYNLCVSETLQEKAKKERMGIWAKPFN